ncbi:hypothetical protein AGMMS49944_15600 [Spirochaetia bacterium]|nr:hypothetical protein AGMMS49944_15600 [Spirochaetia bacterium]
MAGNVGLLGVGAQYERVFTPKLSVGAGIYWYSLVLFSTFGLEANVRYYPFSGRLQGLYGDVGLGFGIAINAYGDEDSWGSMGGFLLRPGIGWKFDVGKPGGFFIEPHLSIPLVFGTREKEVYRSGYGYDTESTADVGANFVARMALGYAF